MNRLCPACRLTRAPSQLNAGEEAGIFFVFAICNNCALRYSRLPHGTRIKLLNAALRRVSVEPDRYLAASFADQGAMHLAAGMLGHELLADEAARAFGWS